MQLRVKYLIQPTLVLLYEGLYLILQLLVTCLRLNSQQNEVDPHQDQVILRQLVILTKLLKDAPFLGSNVGIVNDGNILRHFEEFLVEIIEQFLF